MNILLGEISSYKAIVIARFLQENYPQVNLFTYDYHKLTNNIKTRYSQSNRHFILDHQSTSAYLESLSALVKKLEIDIFIPVHSNYIGDILKQKKIFNGSLSYMGNYDDYQKLHKKDLLQKIAKSLGIDTPVNYKDIEAAKTPFVAKPIEGSSAKGVKYFRDGKPDIPSFESDTYVFQEYVEGSGCGYSVYARDGQILTGYGHKRLAEFPITGGSSIYRKSFCIDEMKEAAQKILQKIKWTGFAMFEFKHTKTGRLVLIEVNPRIWGSFNQGLQNGTNYFEPVLGQAQRELNHTDKINTYLSPQIFLVLLLYMSKFNFKPLGSFFANRSKNRADISLFDDPFGWLSVIFRTIM
jgi:predicted ATP-grasp superfamily ATP-dependent carboligase